MNSSIRESKILWENAKYLGFNLSDTYSKSAEIIVEDILKKHSKRNSFAVLVGKAGNGADGLAVALQLYKNGVDDLIVYTSHEKSKIENQISLEFIDKLQSIDVKVIFAVQPEDIEQPDIFIEALVGTGIENDSLRKKFKGYTKRFSHFGSKKIAIDMPTPHYTPDLVYSIHVPKFDNAIVVETSFPKEVSYFCGPGEWENLEFPNDKTHTSKNGTLVFLAETDSYKKVVKDTTENNVSKTHFIFMDALKRNKIEDYIEEADSFIFGDLENDFITRSLFEKIITESPKTPVIIYGNSLKLLKKADTTWLENALLIIKKNELSKPDFDLKESTLKRFCKTHGISVLLLGNRTTLCNQEGDVRMLSIENVSHPDLVPFIATRIATHAIRNDMWLAARAGMYF